MTHNPGLFELIRARPEKKVLHSFPKKIASLANDDSDGVGVESGRQRSRAQHDDRGFDRTTLKYYVADGNWILDDEAEIVRSRARACRWRRPDLATSYGARASNPGVSCADPPC